MTRENKLALVVGFGLILFVGILISDHFSVARTQMSADLSGVNDPLTNHVAQRDNAIVDLNAIPEPVLPPPAPAAPTTGLQPGELAVGPTIIPTNPVDHQPILDEANQNRISMVDPNANLGPATINDPVTPSPNVPEGFNEIPQDTEVELANVRFHEVRGGESLFGICKQYFGNASLVTALAKFNKIDDPTSLRAGHRLMIPEPAQLGVKTSQVAINDAKPQADSKTSGLRVVTEKITPAATPKAPAKQAAPKGKTHTVKRGESLSQIAQRVYGNKNKWKKILDLNKHQIDDPDDVKVGMVLRLS